MIRAIKENGGAAPVAVIQEYVAKRWGRLRKRDGSRYTYDYRRYNADTGAHVLVAIGTLELQPNNSTTSTYPTRST